MRIEQAYVSPSLSHFRYEFLECWDLREYDNPEEPAVFYCGTEILYYYYVDQTKKYFIE